MDPLTLIAILIGLATVFYTRRFLRRGNRAGLLGIACAFVALLASMGAWHSYMIFDSLGWAAVFAAILSLAVIGTARWLVPVR